MTFGKKMKTIFLAIATLITAPVMTARGDEDKVHKAFQDGMITKAFLDTLTHDDVPKKWQERVEEEKKGKYLLRNYFRGDRKVLTVTWSEDWIEAKAKMFSVTVYDGDTRISRISRFGDSSNIFQPNPEDGYSQIVSLKDDGSVLVLVKNDDGYFEGIEVKGRDTNLMDDLEYTKTVVTIEKFVAPLIESITDQIESPARGSDKPTTQKKNKETEQGAPSDGDKPTN